MSVEWLVGLLLAMWGITLIAWGYDKWNDRREREELYNRLLSRDILDYRQGQGAPPKPVENPLKRNIRDAYKHQYDDDTDA